MKQPLFPKNVPIDEKRIAFIEKIVTRLTRRAQRKTSAMITPYPISSAVFGEDVKGTVLVYMFPCTGTITKGLVDIGKRLKEGATIEIDLRDKTGGQSKTYIMSRATFLSEPNISVDSGDRLKISIFPNSDEEFITEAWVSFLWVPSVKEVTIKQHLISKLENDLLEEE